jgi:hypothetical protein
LKRVRRGPCSTLPPLTQKDEGVLIPTGDRICAGKLKPIIDEVFPFDQALKAYDRQKGGRCVSPSSLFTFTIADSPLRVQVEGKGRRFRRLNEQKLAVCRVDSPFSLFPLPFLRLSIVTFLAVSPTFARERKEAKEHCYNQRISLAQQPPQPPVYRSSSARLQP